MIDGTEIITAALADFGTDAEVNGNPELTLRVIPELDGQDELVGDTVEHTGPFAIALESDVVAAGIIAGNNGSTLTILGDDYTVLAIDPDKQGGVALQLEAI